MLTMRNTPVLLVAVDFSTHAEEICSHAADLALRLGADIVLLHILVLGTWLKPTSVIYSPDTGEAVEAGALLEADARTHLAPLVEALQGRGIAVRLSLREGGVVEQVWAAVEEEGAYMLVMGSDVPEGLRRLLHSSFTEDVLRAATCPVMVVKTGTTRAAPGPSAAQAQVAAEADG